MLPRYAPRRRTSAARRITGLGHRHHASAAATTPQAAAFLRRSHDRPCPLFRPDRRRDLGPARPRPHRGPIARRGPASGVVPPEVGAARRSPREARHGPRGRRSCRRSCRGCPGREAAPRTRPAATRARMREYSTRACPSSRFQAAAHHAAHGVSNAGGRAAGSDGAAVRRGTGRSYARSAHPDSREGPSSPSSIARATCSRCCRIRTRQTTLRGHGTPDRHPPLLPAGPPPLAGAGPRAAGEFDRPQLQVRCSICGRERVMTGDQIQRRTSGGWEPRD